MMRGTAETDRALFAVSTAEALLHYAAKEFDNLLCPDGDRRQIGVLAPAVRFYG